jgi:hypothetical protein
MFILRNPEILSKAVKGLCVAGLCVAGLCVALDTNHGRPYSVPFRTKSLNSIKQRPDGSVGVEALLDHWQ